MLGVPGESLIRAHSLWIPVLDESGIRPAGRADQNSGRVRAFHFAIDPLEFAFAFKIDILAQDAGWSSLVARQAHNLKAAGSNPAPATNSRRMPATYRVYILRNREGKFYIGLTEDVAQRVEQHNSGKSRWTKTRGPWTLAWQSEKLSLTDARKLENRLKRQGRGKGFYSITGLHRSGS